MGTTGLLGWLQILQGRNRGSAGTSEQAAVGWGSCSGGRAGLGWGKSLFSCARSLAGFAGAVTWVFHRLGWESLPRAWHLNV